MLVINKKRIKIIFCCVLIGIFSFSFRIASVRKQDTYELNNVIETTSIPVSGKTVVVDAGHGLPDEGVSLLH